MTAISVIIPTYNRSLTVGKAIESVLQQTYRDFEIYVIDDGSTDNTWDALAPYREYVFYEYKENGGIASARNRGLELAKGDYIAFLDSDDFWKPEKLQRQLECFSKHPEYGLVATRCITNRVDNDFNSISIRKIRRSGKSGWVYPALFCRNFLRTSSVMVKKECFQDVGKFDEAFPRCEEIDMWLRLSKKYPVGFINDTLTVYTRRPKETRHNKVEGRKFWLQVLEKNYDPELIPRSMYKKRLGRIYNHIAESALEDGNREEGKQALDSAFALSPLDFRAWKNYLFFLVKGGSHANG